MANQILISVFTFNVESFIESLFVDLKKYGHLNKEIICLNNNSSDNTVKKINEIKLKNKQTVIQMWKQTKEDFMLIFLKTSYLSESK